MSSPPAGWLQDPDDQHRERWWDGSAWTDHRRLAPAAASASAPLTGDLNPLAVAALVASLVWLGGFGSVAAIVLGVIARQQIDRSGDRERGRGLAVAGIVIGALGLVPVVLMVFGGLLTFAR